MSSIFILGRQPAIGRAELESLYGAEHLEAIHDHAMLGDMSPADVNFDRIGSTIKVGEVLAVLPSSDWQKIQFKLNAIALDRAKLLGEGKVQLGLSSYGIRVNTSQLIAGGLNVKKALRKANYSVRLVPNNDAEDLSSATVIHNHLTGERGLELLLVRHGSETIVAQTTDVQDITAYAARDQGRPKRDAFVGMLSPKLAQTIINLAGTHVLPKGARPSDATLETLPLARLLDPFCGTGVILQEALLMGYDVLGSDLEKRMVSYTETNLKWLADNYSFTGSHEVLAGDATNAAWSAPINLVASEVYLGRPLSSWPTPDKLQEIKGACNVILEKFLRNIAGQIKPGTRLCLAVPAWKAPEGRIHHLSTLDRLEDLGYNRVSFANARDEELVYHRPEQLVARELLVITRK